MITEAQRRALFALREALRLCEGAEVALDANGGEDLRLFIADEQIAVSNTAVELVNATLAAYPEPSERFIGKATPETASGNQLSWRFRTVQGRILRWGGESTAAWWASEDKPQTVPGYRLDWATCDVFEVPA